MAQDKYIDGFIEKLNEWGKSEELCEMVIDTYTTALTKEGWEEDDILCLLEQTADYFVDGVIRSRLKYEATAIKVNSGY